MASERAQRLARSTVEVLDEPSPAALEIKSDDLKHGLDRICVVTLLQRLPASSVNLIWPLLILSFGPPSGDSSLCPWSERSPAASVGRRL
jgi:aryl carrier-like protein